MRRQQPLPKALLNPRSIKAEGFGVLSKREEQVLSFAAAGYIDKEIGPHLGVSVNTLRTFWQRIRQKVGEVPRSALAAAYVTYVAQNAAKPKDGDMMPSWEIDLLADRIHFLADPPHPMAFLEGKTMAQVVGAFVTDEQKNLQETIAQIHRGELNSFFLTGSMNTPQGRAAVHSYVQVDRDETGTAIRLTGKRLPIVNVSGETQPDYDEEIDLNLRTFRRISSRPIPHNVAVGETVPLEQIFLDYHPDDQPTLRTLFACAKAGKLDTFNFTGRVVTDTGIIPSGGHVTVSRGPDGHVCCLSIRQSLSFGLDGIGGSVIEAGAFTYDPYLEQFHPDDVTRKLFDLSPNDPRWLSRMAKKLDPAQSANFRNLFKHLSERASKTFGITYASTIDGPDGAWIRFEFILTPTGAISGKVIAFH